MKKKTVLYVLPVICALFLVIILSERKVYAGSAHFMGMPVNYDYIYPGHKNEIFVYFPPAKGVKVTVSSSNSKIVKVVDSSFSDYKIVLKGLKSGTAIVTVKQRLKNKTKVSKIKVVVAKYKCYYLHNKARIKIKNNTVIISGNFEYYDPAIKKSKKLKSKTRKLKLSSKAYVGSSFLLGYHGYSVHSNNGKQMLKNYRNGWEFEKDISDVQVEVVFNNKNEVLFLCSHSLE